MNEVKPSAKLLILPIVGIAAGVALLVFGIMGMIGGITAEKQSLYHGAVITVEEGGKYGIFYEYRHAYRLNEDVEFTFTDSDGRSVASRYPNGTSTYSVNGVNGEQVAVVSLEPGVYTVGTTQRDSELSFVLDNGSVVGGILSGAFGLTGGLLLLIFSVVGLVIILVIRSSNKRKLRDNPYYNM